MKYIQPVGGAASDPYVDANPSGGIEGSPVPAAAIEHPQRELVALLVDAGIAPTDADLTQVTKAVRTLIQRQSSVVVAAGGTADALVGAYSPAVTTLSNGMVLYIRASAANTSSTPTFTPNNGVVAAKGIVKMNGAPLAPADIAGAGHWLELQYDSVQDKWVLQNPGYGAIFGIGQSAQNMTGSRALGANYTNTTARPIVIRVLANAGAAGNSIGLFVSGYENAVSIAQAAGQLVGLTAVVMPGETYQAANSGCTLSNWFEVR